MRDILELLKFIYIPDTPIPDDCVEFNEKHQFKFPLERKSSSLLLANLKKQSKIEYEMNRKLKLKLDNCMELNFSLLLMQDILVERLEHIEHLVNVAILLLSILLLLLIF